MNRKQRRKTKTTERLGDADIEPTYRARMEHLASAIDGFFNGDLRGQDRQTGFVLMVYRYGDEPGNRCNYISNGADRKDVVALMKEMIARFEGQPEMKGTA
jgi:hypothetical protein